MKEKYCIGIEVEGLESMDIEDSDAISNCEESTVVILLDEASNGKLYTYYTAIRSLIVKGNRVIVLMEEDKSKISKQICMLMASYKRYDLYIIEDKSVINNQYIARLENREPSESEVSTFISSDITAFSEMEEIIASITDCIYDNNVDKLTEIVSEHTEELENFTEVISYMKIIVDKASSGETEVDKLKEKISLLEQEVENSAIKIDKLKKDYENMEKERDIHQKEAMQAKRRVIEFEENMNSKETVINSYNELQTSTINCKARVIMYVKEVSKINFIASTISQFKSFLENNRSNLTKEALRVKLVIYDNKTSFLGTYINKQSGNKQLPIIGSTEFVGSRDIVVNSYPAIVVVETNQAIIEEILKADYDVVIVYDRLKQAQDIVSGNNVYKFWVLNSLSEFDALKNSYKIPEERVITRVGVLQGSIAIDELNEYKTKTDAAKLMAYITMINRNVVSSKERVFDRLIKTMNIESLIHKA